MTNPFAPQGAPAEQQQAAPANPFGQGVAVQQQAAPQAAGNPFGAAPQTPAAAFPAATQQQAAAPATQQAAPPPMLDPNALRAAAAPVISTGKGPDLAAMYGRLVLMFPHSLTRVPRKPEHITAEQRAAGNVEQDQMTTTVVVLDSGPGTAPGTGSIPWGGKPHALGGEPHTNNDPLPYVRKGMWINQSRLISQLRDFMPAHPGAAPGMITGRLVKTGPESNAPWYLTTATAEEMAITQQYLTAVGQGVFPHPLAA